MSPIKRYTLKFSYDDAEMIECQNGEYVKFEDFNKAAELVDFLAGHVYTLENQLDRVWDSSK